MCCILVYLIIVKILYYIEDCHTTDRYYLTLKIDHETIEKLQLDLTAFDIRKALLKHKKLKLVDSEVMAFTNSLRIEIKPSMSNKVMKAKGRDNIVELYQRNQFLKRALPHVAIRGYPEASRAIIKTDDKDHNTLLVEGYGLRACMTTEGVNGLSTKTNSVMEMRDVLGIEAARKTIIDEIGAVMGDMDIDPRHMQLLADVMTSKGDVLGITRFGMSKMRDSVLQLASFEKTTDHLFEAAWRMKSDKIEGVSECIILGQSMSIGTGAFETVRALDLQSGDLCKKETIFEDCFRELRSSAAKKR